MPPIATMPLYLVVPCHLPISATVEHYREKLHKCYLPLVEAIEKNADVRVTLHLGGHLLDMLARHDEQVLLRLKTLCQGGQCEILGGLFYGGPVALLPEQDVRGQIAMSQEFWESFIGVTPQGIYLPQLAWASELPRLLQDSGILYSFIGSNQRMSDPNHTGALGRVERGGQRLYTFTIDAPLSQKFAPDQLAAFVARLTQHHAQQLQARRPMLHGERQPWGTGVCLPGELFGSWDVGPHVNKASIEPLFAALLSHPLFDLELPLSHFANAPKVVSVALGSCYAPIVPEHFSLDPLHDWSQFPGHFFEADTLYRRMLRLSSRLQSTIARMEDEHQEHAWSDTLATAQRQLFAAQSIDALGRGHWPGFSDPAVRDAAYGRILQAEAAIDGLSPRAAPYIDVVREDLDGDWVDDRFISTAQLNVWLLPGRGGALRTIEHKALGINVCDVGTRREDPFRAQAVLAQPLQDHVGDACATQHLTLLPTKGAAVSPHVDVCERSGIKDWLLPVETKPQELISGHVRSLADIRRPWTMVHDAFEAGKGHLFAMSADAELSKGGVLHLHKEILVHDGAARLSLCYTLTPKLGSCADEGVLWAIEMPWRLGLEPLEVALLDGTPQSMGHHVAPRGYTVRGLGHTITTTLEGVDEIFWSPRMAIVRDPDGFREVPVGSVVVAASRIYDEAKTLRVTFNF